MLPSAAPSHVLCLRSVRRRLCSGCSCWAAGVERGGGEGGVALVGVLAAGQACSPPLPAPLEQGARPESRRARG
eukprot:scaffold171169_cov18-Tisochrysis_lutea.AAC.1